MRATSFFVIFALLASTAQSRVAAVGALGNFDLMVSATTAPNDASVGNNWLIIGVTVGVSEGSFANGLED